MNRRRFATIWRKNKFAKPKIESLTEIFQGRTLYVVNIPVDDKKVICHIKRIQNELPKEILSLVPANRFHITIKILGFETKNKDKKTIDPRTLNTIKNMLPSIAKALRRPLVIGPINRFQNVIFLEVHNTEEIKKAHESLFSVVKTDFGYEGRSFLPHLTIARFIGVDKQKIGRIVELRKQSSIMFNPRTLQLSSSWFEKDVKKKKMLRRCQTGA